jgi:hypothetical protein
MIFSTDLSETFVILRRIHRDIIIYLGRSPRKLTVILVYFNDSWIFSTDFFKKPQILNFMKLLAVGAVVHRTDKKTDGQIC